MTEPTERDREHARVREIEKALWARRGPAVSATLSDKSDATQGVPSRQTAKNDQDRGV